MLPKNGNKNKIYEQKNQELNFKKHSTFKNLYAEIRKNIKTSFPRSKQKNSINTLNSKRLTENLTKKNQNYNINLFFPKKTEESRNYNTNNIDNIYIYNPDDDELFDYDENYNFNKTQKDINLSHKYSKKNLNNKITPNINDDFKISKGKRNNSKESNFNDGTKKQNNKFLWLQNKRIKGNIEIKKINANNLLNKNDFEDNYKNKINENRGKNSLENVSKISINKKILLKEELIKNKILYENIKSARLTNHDSHKLNINTNNELISESKNDSNKKTFRMNSQKNIKINNKEFEKNIITQAKKLKRAHLIRQLTNQKSKNHSMNLKKNDKDLFLNDNIKNLNIKKNKKFNIINIYNYPSIRNNSRKSIPYSYNSSDKKNENKENSEKKMLNNYYNIEHTYINTNNKLFETVKNQNGHSPISKNHTNSFSNPNNKEKISNGFLLRPVARLKKRIFDSPSDKENENSTNSIKINNNKEFYYINDSLEINNNNKTDNNYNFKDLLISIKILTQIINTQKKIIKDYILNENNLKKEIIQKNNEIKKYKEICLILTFHLKQEKEINFSNELNKKRNQIQFQLIKENELLRKLLSSSIEDIKIDFNQRTENKENYVNKKNISGDNSSYNFYHLPKNGLSNFSKENNISINKLNELNIRNDVIKNSLNGVKKRDKSYENKRTKRNIENIHNINKNKLINNNLNQNTGKSNKKICYIVKDKNFSISNDKNII